MFGLAPRTKSTPRQSKLQSPVAGKDGDTLVVGRRVRTHPKGLMGVVRWVGPTDFSDGMWIGVELDNREGRNDGEVQGTRYFNCIPGHGVFVRPENCVATRGVGSPTVPASPVPVRERRPRPSLERTPLSRKGSQTSLAPEHFGASGHPANGSGIPASSWATGSEAGGSVRKDTGRRGGGGGGPDRRGNHHYGGGGGGDDQIIGRLLASEAFSRVLAVKVADRVRAELTSRDAQFRADQEKMSNRICDLEQMVDDAGGAMDDIATMVQTISESVVTGPVVADARDAAAGGGGGGDAGGGGRDDARVAELTKLLCTVHDMSSQAAELLRTERKENQARVHYLTDRVRELEKTNKELGNSVPSEPSEG